MNTLAWLIAEACLVWASVAISRWLDRHYDRRQENA